MSVPLALGKRKQEERMPAKIKERTVARPRSLFGLLSTIRWEAQFKLANRLLKNWGKGRRVCLRRRIGIFGVWQLAFGAGLKSLKPPLRSTVAA